MQEQDNAKLVQEMYAAFGRGDIQAIMQRVAPDVEWIMEGPDSIPITGRRKGSDQVRQFFRDLQTTQSDAKLTIDQIVSQGDTVATHGRYAGRVTATGKRFDSAVAHFFTIRDGKVVQFLDYADTAQIASAYVASASATT